MAMHAQPIIQLEAGWALIDQHGLQKLKEILRTGALQQSQAAETNNNHPNMTAITQQQTTPNMCFTNEEYARLYTSVWP